MSPKGNIYKMENNLQIVIIQFTNFEVFISLQNNIFNSKQKMAEYYQEFSEVKIKIKSRERQLSSLKVI